MLVDVEVLVDVLRASPRGPVGATGLLAPHHLQGRLLLQSLAGLLVPVALGTAGGAHQAPADAARLVGRGVVVEPRPLHHTAGGARRRRGDEIGS